jgi:hypothetical protein
VDGNGSDALPVIRPSLDAVRAADDDDVAVEVAEPDLAVMGERVDVVVLDDVGIGAPDAPDDGG